MSQRIILLVLCIIVIIVDYIIFQKDLIDYIKTKDKWYLINPKEIVLSIILASFALGYNLAVLLIK